MFQPPFHPDNCAIWHSFQNLQCANVVFARFEKCGCRFFVPPKPNNHWISRRCVGGRPSGFGREATEQNRCPETQRLLGGTSLKLAFRQTGTQCLAGDVFTGNFCPMVPLKFRKNIFDHFHNVAHRGRLASCHIISSRFVWRGLSSNVTARARGCPACHWGKSHSHTRLVPLPFPIPQRRFSHLHVDLVGPLQYSNNLYYIFNTIDRTSKWMEAIPLLETSAAACAKALTFTLISRFGVPEMITSDRGPQFTSNLWFQLYEMLNISHKQTTAYHPESNGCTAASRTRFAHALPRIWSEELPFVLLGLRVQPREDTGLSPAEAVFSAQIVLPNEFLQNDELSVDTIVKKFSKTLHVAAPSLLRQNSSTDLPSELPAELLSAPLVWVHRGSLVPPLQPLYNGPYELLRRGPPPSPSESGRGTRWSPSATLRLARLRTPRLAARVTAADSRACAQAV